MPEKSLLADIPAWLQAIVTAAFGALGALALALLNRGPALDAVINARIDALLKADADRMKADAELLKADADRMNQMSDALEENGRKFDQLRASVETLVRHVLTLEQMLEAAGVPVPPRPVIVTAET